MRSLILGCSTCRIACSTLAGEFLYGRKAGFELLHNSVDTSSFLDRYDRREEGEFTGDGWCNVLQVGRITPVKNQLFLVEVAAELRRRNRPIRILCAGPGDGSYPRQVADAITAQALDEHIRLLGTRTDIDSLMRKSAAFVLPSKYEGMPLVLIEAQASGLSCICADTFSHEVDFGIGTLTWLPVDADAARWADAIEKAVTVGRASRTAVAEAVDRGGFDSRCFAGRLCRLYETACGGAVK
jgi:glycosyltransferase EpsF